MTNSQDQTVLHISKFFPPDKGGMETVLDGMTTILAKNGLPQNVLCYSNFNSDEYPSEEITVRRRKINFTFRSQPISFSYQTSINKSLKEHWKCVLLHLPNPLATIPFCFSTSKSPVIAVYHADITKQKLLNEVYSPALKGFLSACKQIWISSPNILKYSPHLKNFESKIKIIPFGIDLKKFKSTELPKNGFKVLYIGRMVGYKGVDQLLNALSRSSSCTEANFIGTGPELDSLKTLSQELNLKNKVIWHEQVSENKKLELIKNSHVICLPSISEAEAYGMVQIEAFASARAVISTDLPTGVPWVNQNEVSGLVVSPSSPEELANAIERVANDRELLEKLSAGALERSKLFSLEEMGKNCMNAIQKL